MEYASKLDAMSKDIYRYMNFDQMKEFQNKAEKAISRRARGRRFVIPHA